MTEDPICDLLARLARWVGDTNLRRAGRLCWQTDIVSHDWQKAPGSGHTIQALFVCCHGTFEALVKAIHLDQGPEVGTRGLWSSQMAFSCQGQGPVLTNKPGLDCQAMSMFGRKRCAPEKCQPKQNIGPERTHGSTTAHPLPPFPSPNPTPAHATDSLGTVLDKSTLASLTRIVGG